MTANGGCVAIELEDGSTVLVRVKPGETLTDEDIAVLREVFELKRKAKKDNE